ncbi:MAG: cellulase family glycosylhydrolase [Cellvibrio sp.]
MKKLSPLALMIASIGLLAGCGGSMLGESDAEAHKMIPDKVDEDPNPQRPSAGLNVLTTQDGDLIYNGERLTLRGINLQYHADPMEMYPGIKATRDVGSNVIRILVSPDTTVNDLEAALVAASSNNLFTILTLDSPDLFCNDNEALFSEHVKNTWLKKFLPVIHQDRFQENLIINLARGWGPSDIFNGYSTGYLTYIDNYKTAMRALRQAGFEVPIMIDAPCGEDFYAFDSNRGRELFLNDPERNIVLGVHAYGSAWNNPEKIETAIGVLNSQKTPFILGEFGGSGVGERAVNHRYLMERAADNYAYEVDVPWASDADKVGIVVPLTEVIDVTNHEISYEIKLAKSYVDDGKLGFQAFLIDENGNYANIGWNQAGSQIADTYSTIKKSITNAEAFGWRAPGFDQTRVAKIGVELIANGKAPDVRGPIGIDNFKIVEGGSSFSRSFISSIDGWNTGWNGTTLSLKEGEGLALLKADDTDQISVIFSGITGIDFTQPVKITANMFFPKGFEGSYLYGKFFNNTTNNDDGSCCAWLTSTDISGVVYGEWNTIELTADFGANGATISSLGLQLGNLGVGEQTSTFNGEIIIKDLTVAGLAASTATEEGELYRQTFDTPDTDNWNTMSWGDAGVVSTENGALKVLPKDDAYRLDLQHANPARIEGLNFADPFTVKARIFIPEYYAAVETFALQFYLQDGNWSHHFNAIDLAHEDIIFGDWNDLDVAVVFPDGFDRVAPPKHMGFSFATSFDKVGPMMSKTDAILIDEIVFEGMVPVPKEEVVLDNIDYHYASHFDNTEIAPAYTEGLAPEVVAEAASLSLRAKGFSWAAATWFGAPAEQAALDLAKVVDDATSLTDRGIEIVNGKGGIGEIAPEPEATSSE